MTLLTTTGDPDAPPDERRPGELRVSIAWVPGDDLSLTDVTIDRPDDARPCGPWGEMSLLTIAVFRLQGYLDDDRDAARADLAEIASS